MVEYSKCKIDRYTTEKGKNCSQKKKKKKKKKKTGTNLIMSLKMFDEK